MGSQRVTLQTIADRVGVTKMTVSNAFARPEHVSPALRARILAAAAELGYAGPDPSARALARGRTGTVGVLLTDQPASAFADEVALALVAGVARGLSARSLSLVLLADQPAGDFVPARDVAMDGAILYACSQSDDGLQRLLARRLPIVGVDQFDVPDLDLVNIDDRGGARVAADHLARLGHRHVAGVPPWLDAPEPINAPDPTGLAPGKQFERWAGWRDGLAPHGVVPRVWGRALELDRASAAEVAARVLRSSDRPTAVLCFSDVIAAGVLDAAADAGLEVPRDLSVVGFDDSPLASSLRPALTTVRQDLGGKGAAAVGLLFEAMDAAGTGVRRAPRHVVLETELIVRSSTGPAPALA